MDNNNKIIELIGDLKEDIGAIKQEQKGIKEQIDLMGQILQKQSLQEEKILRIERDIEKHIEKIENKGLVCSKEDNFKFLESKIKEASRCKNDQNVANLQKDIDRLQANMTKLAFTAIPTFLAVSGLIFRIVA